MNRSCFGDPSARRSPGSSCGLCFLALLLFFTIALTTARAADRATPVAATVLHNVFRIDAGLLSGDSPESTKSFQELQKLGVKTIISVDGSQPHVALAHHYGMRYVHLPFGYDGLPRSRALELTKAVRLYSSSGPIYVHCHHGKHRGPAAVAAICRATRNWSAADAEAFLHDAGTSAEYAGLFRDVRAYTGASEDELARVSPKFPEIATTPPLVDTMVALDKFHDALGVFQQAGWRKSPAGRGPSPGESAVLVWELLREMARGPEVRKSGVDFAKLRAQAENAGDTLRQLLEDPASDRLARNRAFEQLSASCAACHKAHRN